MTGPEQLLLPVPNRDLLRALLRIRPGCSSKQVTSNKRTREQRVGATVGRSVGRSADERAAARVSRAHNNPANCLGNATRAGRIFGNYPCIREADVSTEATASSRFLHPPTLSFS